jgi:hypothetical protein
VVLQEAVDAVSGYDRWYAAALRVELGADFIGETVEQAAGL